MSRSAGLKFCIVGLLALLMFIPLFFVGAVIDDRSSYSRDTVRTVSQEWGGAQTIGGPVLVIPVEEEVTERKRRHRLDPETGEKVMDAEGKWLLDWVDETVVVNRPAIQLQPGQFNVSLDSTSEIRKRGIFEVPVYAAEAQMTFDFPTDKAASVLTGKERIIWEKAELQMSLGSNRSLRGTAALTHGKETLALEPLAPAGHGQGGVRAEIGDPRQRDTFAMTLGFNGAQSLHIVPAGRDTTVNMVSDWPHPSFTGAFLPNGSTITEAGFEANWSIPHLARPIPQVQRTEAATGIDRSQTFGVAFFQPNDFYQKAYRAGRYGILYIALTFLTVLLVEDRTRRPAHPVQYILIGLAQSMFVLMMVAFAEQIGFGAAYALASAATIGILVMFGATALKLGKRVFVLGAMLAVLYAVLYLILRSADYALLAGTCLAFAALAGTMYATRNEDWYGPERPKRRWFGSDKTPPPAPAQPTP
ncbi:cell envelope integrity protein CreD [Actibacterium sp. 188UL27-1]|uniref:cell envelope integrity protein CreD n=1 Tax=Actibacterium sp. 188UL27-1 TaxID=2786961 RepID=UPI00195A29A9|nr:cell envelope integrity protein CreD [Actibacterium sp. 188UL27-1]MBM7066532.1 cell envelope integrity protein CreD [Actibacterium sp. 188UL27-1]